MKFAFRLSVILSILFIIMSSVARSGELDPSEISGKAKWAAHIDIQGLVSSRIGSLVLDEAKKEKDFVKVEAFSTIVEFDPFKDLYSVTLYGTSFSDEEGLVILKGRFEEEKLLALLKAEAGEIEEIQHNNYRVYHANDGSDAFYGSFAGRNRVVLSNSEALIFEALDVLGGKSPSLKDQGALVRLRDLPSGALLAAEARGFGRLGEDIPDARMLKKADSARLIAGEHEGRFFVDLSLTAQDEETARLVRDMVQGFIALGTIAGEEEPDLARLVRAARVELDGAKVTLSHAMPSDELFDLLKDKMD